MAAGFIQNDLARLFADKEKAKSALSDAERSKGLIKEKMAPIEKDIEMKYKEVMKIQNDVTQVSTETDKMQEVNEPKRKKTIRCEFTCAQNIFKPKTVACFVGCPAIIDLE